MFIEPSSSSNLVWFTFFLEKERSIFFSFFLTESNNRGPADALRGRKHSSNYKVSRSWQNRSKERNSNTRLKEKEGTKPLLVAAGKPEGRTNKPLTRQG
jgi:hypothetical protein